MRKMLSRKQTIDLVNEAIESGEIHADPSTEVKVGDINSESATAGKVIVADGTGGASWGEVGGALEFVELPSYSGTATEEQLNKLLKGAYPSIYGDVYDVFSQSASQLIYAHTATGDSNLIVTLLTINKQSRVYSAVSRTYYIGEPIAYEGTSALPSGASFSDWTLHRGIRDGNILWMTLVGQIINDSGSSIGPAEVYSITLPSALSSKIYRQDGTTCNNAYSSSTQVLFGNGVQGTTTARFSITSASANTLSVWVLNAINSGTSAFVDLRVPIFLDIGA